MDILILTDYRDQFWLKSDYKEQNFDVALLKESFESHGYNVEVKRFGDLNLREETFSGTWVVYQSSEDPGLYYKSYIEDMLLALELAGAKLLPPFHLFRAHHNKVFMELLRQVSGLGGMQQPSAEVYGTYEEYVAHVTDQTADEHCVLKLSEGAQSKNVRLLASPSEKRRLPRRLSRTFNWYYWLIDQIKPLWRSRYPNYRRKSHHRHKFVIQQFIPGLTGDYKVLVFGNKYYVLSRDIRPGDFRASGSGRFSFPDFPPHLLLDFSERVFKHFDVPFISLDLAVKSDQCYLLEFQFVSFGCYTLEKSPYWFERQDGCWKKHEGSSVVEEQFAEALSRFIESKTP